MSKEAIIARIQSDAEGESQTILAEAHARADGIISAAELHAAAERTEIEAELQTLCNRIAEVNAAAARLDCAKIQLAEKRRVIETIYDRALQNLLALGEHESLALLEKLLMLYAAEGDEIILDEKFAYRDGAAKLPVIGERNLSVSNETAKLNGGCLLRGKRCDKDLSYPALLKSDMETYQSELAAKLFK